jgi:hypothetical protein
MSKAIRERRCGQLPPGFEPVTSGAASLTRRPGKLMPTHQTRTGMAEGGATGPKKLGSGAARGGVACKFDAAAVMVVYCGVPVQV